MNENEEGPVEGQPVADNTEGPVEFGTPATDASHPEPTEETVENPARPEATNDPHPVDEDPEEHIGDEVPDPWLEQKHKENEEQWDKALRPQTSAQNFTDAGE